MAAPIRKLLVVVALTFGFLIALAAPASAHATLKDTAPRNGERLDAGPKNVLLRFSESVEGSLGAVRVFDGDGNRIDSGRISHPNGDGAAVSVALPKLDDGSYVVTWRVISSDSHPIQGAFTFLVGDAKAVDEGEVAGLLADRAGSDTVGVLYSAGRSIAFAAMLLLLGGAAFLVLVWPDGTAVRGVRRGAVVAWSVLVVATLANLLLQGAYGGGLGLGEAFSWSVIDGVLDTRFGHVYVARLALLATAVPLLAIMFRRAFLPKWWRVPALLVGGAVAATPGLAGHASKGSHRPWALVADVLHVGAASVWVGGLVVLVVFALPRRTDDLAALTRRFGQLAFGAVTVLVATGLFQAWRQVGTLDALTSTSFGTLLIVKTSIVVAMLGMAFLSRRATFARWTANTASKVRRTVVIEAALAVAVLSVTGLLVNAVPAKVLAAAPQSGELTSATMLIDYTVSPGRAGVNTIHLYTLTKAGQPQAVVEMTLTMSLPDQGIAPIPVDLQLAGPGHYQALDLQLPLKGRWRMDVTARTSDIDQEVFDGTVDIR